MNRISYVVLIAVALAATPTVAQVMTAEEHRRPAQVPRVLAPPGTRTLVVALGTGHPAKDATEAKVKLLVLYHEQDYSDPYDPESLIKELRMLGVKGDVVSSRDADVL